MLCNHLLIPPVQAKHQLSLYYLSKGIMAGGRCMFSAVMKDGGRFSKKTDIFQFQAMAFSRKSLGDMPVFSRNARLNGASDP
jgi:hypothetical protein